MALAARDSNLSVSAIKDVLPISLRRQIYARSRLEEERVPKGAAAQKGSFIPPSETGSMNAPHRMQGRPQNPVERGDECRL